MKSIVKLAEKVESVTAYFSVSLVFGMTLIVLFQVASRYIGKGYGWTEELSRYFLVWMGMLGAAHLVHDNGDVRVEFGVNAMPAKLRKACEVAGMILIFVFAAAMLWFGGVRAFRMGMEVKAVSMNIVMLPFYLSIPAGGALIMLQVAARFVRDTFGKGGES